MKEGETVVITKYGSVSFMLKAKLIKRTKILRLEWNAGQWDRTDLDAWEVDTAGGVYVIEETHLTKLI